MKRKICTASRCSKMTAGPQFDIFWQDPGSKDKPIRVTAPKYFNLFYQSILRSELFGLDQLSHFSDFLTEIKVFFKRCVRLYAHLFFHDLEPALRSELLLSFSNFYKVQSTFNLVQPRELEPVVTIIKEELEPYNSLSHEQDYSILFPLLLKRLRHETLEVEEREEIQYLDAYGKQKLTELLQLLEDVFDTQAQPLVPDLGPLSVYDEFSFLAEKVDELTQQTQTDPTTPLCKDRDQLRRKLYHTASDLLKFHASIESSLQTKEDKFSHYIIRINSR